MDEGDDLGVRVCLERIFQFLRVNRASPVVLHHYSHTTAAFDVLFHASAKHTVLAHDHFVARLNQIDEAGFHAGRAGCGNRHGQFILRFKRVFQQGFHLVHQVDEQRVQMANSRPRHRGQHARADIRRARAHQGSLGRMK